MTLVQAPAGASLDYTSGIARQVEAILIKTPEVLGVFSVMGFSFGRGAQPGDDLSALDHSTSERVMSTRRRPSSPGCAVRSSAFQAHRPAAGAAADQGLGQFGGFQFELLDQSGGPIEDMAAAARAMIGAGNQTPTLRGLFQFTASDPLLQVDLDREKARSLRVPLSEVTGALQVFLGRSTSTTSI